MDRTLRKYSDIDILRSVIVSVTRTDQRHPNKCHILKLDKLSRIFGIEGSVDDALKILENLREVQNIGDGYWAPAPQRSVQINSEWLIFSPVPTPQLSPDLNLLESFGFARLSSNPIPGQLIQTLRGWMGGPHNLPAWILGEISAVKNKLERTTLCKDTLEFYFPWHPQKKNKPIFKNWFLASELSSTSKKDILLTRSTLGGISKYFWCTFEGNTLLESIVGVSKADIVRIQFALEMVNNSPWRELKFTSVQDKISFICKFPLPNEIDRFLLAIGRKSGEERQVTYVVNNRHFDIIRQQFANLHINIE